MRRWMTAALLVAAVVGGGGCSRAIEGTPMATPGQVGSMARINATCRDYVGMSEAERKDVIIAIGEDGNKLVAANPDLWVGVAAALCNFVDPSAPVKDVVTGGMR
ncbi:MAG: hypothetical protein U0R66_12070 [Mycobacterium sp.]